MSYQGLRVLGESFGERSQQVQLKGAVLLTELLLDDEVRNWSWVWCNSGLTHFLSFVGKFLIMNVSVCCTCNN